MASKVVPAKELLICDRCKKEGVRQEDGPFRLGGLHIKEAEEWGASIYGDTGGYNYRLDFCQSCAPLFFQWMREGKK